MSWLTGKDSDAGRDWGQEKKGTTEDEMAGWHHGLDGRQSEWTVGVGDEQAGLACCDSWGRKESDTTEWLNWTELSVKFEGRAVACPFSPFRIHAKLFPEGTGISLNLSRKQKTHSFQVNEESLIMEIYDSVLRKRHVFFKWKSQWSIEVPGICCSECILLSCIRMTPDILSIR